MRIAIIDTDSLIWKSCWFNKGQNTEEEVLASFSERLNEIITQTNSDGFTLCLTVGKCFRYEIYTDYKGNRKGIEKPTHFKFLKDFIIEHFPNFKNPYYEADDLIFILKKHYEQKGFETILCINDKDCLQYEGVYYDYHKKEFVTVDKDSAVINLYTQLITGDTSDNIKGIEGKGVKFASEFITKETSLGHILDLYCDKYGESGIDLFYKYYKVLKILDDDKYGHIDSYPEPSILNKSEAS